MRTLIAALLILLLASPLFAGQTTIALTGTGGSGGTWFYGAGSDTYNGTPDCPGPSTTTGATISVTSGTNITKIATKITTGGAYSIKLALYDNCPVDSCTLLSSGCTCPGASCTTTAGSLPTGWQECTLGTPIAVQTPVYVFGEASHADVCIAGSASGGYAYATKAYADFPGATQGVSSGACCGDAYALFAQ